MKAEEVIITNDPWIVGTQAIAWAGGIELEMVSTRQDRALDFECLLLNMRHEALRRSCNAILSAEFSIDPFCEKGWLMRGKGGAVNLKVCDGVRNVWF